MMKNFVKRLAIPLLLLAVRAEGSHTEGSYINFTDENGEKQQAELLLESMVSDGAYTEGKSGHTIIKKPQFRLNDQVYLFSAEGYTPAAVCRLYGFGDLFAFEEYPEGFLSITGVYYGISRQTVHLYPEAQFMALAPGNGLKWVECGPCGS